MMAVRGVFERNTRIFDMLADNIRLTSILEMNESFDNAMMLGLGLKVLPDYLDDMAWLADSVASQVPGYTVNNPKGRLAVADAASWQLAQVKNLHGDVKYTHIVVLDRYIHEAKQVPGFGWTVTVVTCKVDLNDTSARSVREPWKREPWCVCFQWKTPRHHVLEPRRHAPYLLQDCSYHHRDRFSARHLGVHRQWKSNLPTAEC